MSSMMMHLNVEPEIRAGLMLAKYVVNHPNRFKGVYVKNSKGEYDIHNSRLIPPLFIALSQTFVGLVVEINVLIYLTSLKSLLDVIMKFVTLASICKFDDMYAASLIENKMKAAGGKKLKKYFYRRHTKIESELLLNKGDDDFRQAINYEQSAEIYQTGSTIDFQKPIALVDGEKIYGNPRRNSFLLKCFRFLFKCVRLCYVSVIYYFMPFVFIFITFISNMPLLKESFRMVPSS